MWECDRILISTSSFDINLTQVVNLCFLVHVNRLIVSVAWVAHIVIYLLIDPPLSSFLNEVFIKLDDIWGTFNLSLLCLIS